MKDYLIKFGDDGRRGATYADGVHYQVADDGTVQSTSIDVDSLLQQGYIFVDAKDYNNLLGNNSEQREYCRQPDGSFVPYVAPEPTEEEKAQAARQQLDAEYESEKSALADSLTTAILQGDTDTQASIQADYKDLEASYAESVSALNS